MPNGVPSHDPFGRVFAALDAEPFIRCFLSWVASIHEITAGQVVRIDGQTARASLDRAQGKHPLHVVSAWASANRLVLGQVMVDEKSNAITALPRLLEMLELRGAIVTIDAMGCQKEIAAKVRERGADYVLTVKGNQDPLEEDVIDHFAALDDGGRRGRRRSRHDTADEGHGRQESWYYEAVPAPQGLRNRSAQADRRSICRATRVWREKGEERSAVRYFISSLPADAKVLGEAIRSHWGVENGLHGVLDMVFAEDRSRARTDHAAANRAVPRRWLVSLLRRDRTLTGGIEKKRLQAAWDENILEGILGLS